jgi:hypothetical protein
VVNFAKYGDRNLGNWDPDLLRLLIEEGKLKGGLLPQIFCREGLFVENFQLFSTASSCWNEKCNQMREEE